MTDSRQMASRLPTLPRQTRRNRDLERVRDFKKKGYVPNIQPGTSSWSEDPQENPDERYFLEMEKPRPQQKSRNAQRAAAYKQKKAGKATEGPASQKDDLKATQETPERSEPMYATGPIKGMQALSQNYGYNPDFSTFTTIVSTTYESMREADERISRKMPFTVFQMYCTSALMGAIIHVKYVLNREAVPGVTGDYDVKSYFPNHIVPAPIAEYISHLVGTATLSGDQVRMNIPDIYIPQTAGVNQVQGSFGVITAANHNVVECVPCPLVARRRFQYSLDPPPNRIYQPFPDALLPAGGVATANVLGYGPLEYIHPETRNMLTMIQFPPDNVDKGVQGMMQLSSGILDIVQRTCHMIEDKYKMLPLFNPPKVIPGFTGFLECIDESPSTSLLSDQSATIWSCETAGVSLANEMYLMGLRRRRTEKAPGLSFLDQEGQPLEGWLATRNSNFETVAPFLMQTGVHDIAVLREAKHFGVTSSGLRSNDWTDFIGRNFLIRRRDVR